MKSFKITEQLYLNELEVQLPDTEDKKHIKVSSHQYIIIDRSGSMWSDLDFVVDTITKYVDTLEEGTSVSLGWFSGNSEYGLSVPYELKKEKDGVVKTLDTYRNSLGCTNFTEILQKISKDIQNRPEKSSLFFFTDGCHNCGSFNNVIDVLQQVKDKLEVSIFVGCGWINRQNMIDMANTTSGAFIQLNNMQDFGQALQDFNEGVQDSVPGCRVTLPEDAQNICSILGKNVVSYVKDEDNSIFYKASDKSKQVVFFTSSTPLYQLTNFNKEEVCARTLIYYLVQHNKTPLALQILNVLGDKFYIRKLYNTFTSEEYAKIENDMLQAIFRSRKRYKEGKVANYLPDDNAFCVLDVLDIISNDDTAILHLNDKDFEYKKISRSGIQQDGTKLDYPKDIKANANNIKYHENRLNVNLNVSYSANVILDKSQFKNPLTENMNKYGLTNKQKYPVNCIRNYNIILDGKLNTEKLVLSKLSKESIKKLTDIITFREDGKYVLDMSNLPLINKGYLKYTSAKSLAEKYAQQYNLSVQLSVINYLIKQLQQDSDTETLQESSLEKFLEEVFYIKNNMYNPPKTSVESTDEYQSYEFNIAFKGYSKPSAGSVIKKIENNGSLTEREKIVECYYTPIKNYSLEQLKTLAEVINKQYKEIQTELQHAKFAIILINRGCMDEFDNREDMKINITTTFGNETKELITNFKIISKPVKI